MRGRESASSFWPKEERRTKRCFKEMLSSTNQQLSEDVAGETYRAKGISQL
jgi:hypothetical protein